MSFDIQEKAKLADIEDVGVPVEILDEKDNPALQDDGTPITISVVGSLSKRYRKLQALQRGRAISVKRITKSTDDTEAGARSLKEQTEAVAACITGWSDGFTSGGDPLAFTRANAIMLLTNCPWVQTRLEQAMEDRSRFLPTGSTNSPT